MREFFRRAAARLLRRVAVFDMDEQILRENEYLRAELKVVRAQLAASKKRLRFSDEQRRLLAEKGRALGRRINELPSIVTPATILRWRRELVAKKFDSSKSRRKSGRPPTPGEIENLVLLMARNNPAWGCLRIAGALGNLGHEISKSAVSNLLKNNGVNPSGGRKHGGMSWTDFIRLHKDVIWATDFFTAEVWTKFGLVTYYALFFIHLGTRKVVIAGVSPNPDGKWMTQIASNLTGFDGELTAAKYLIHDRDTKYTADFDRLMRSIGIKPVRRPPRSPNLNAYAENFVGKIKAECLDHIILFVGK